MCNALRDSVQFVKFKNTLKIWKTPIEESYFQ